MEDLSILIVSFIFFVGSFIIFNFLRDLFYEKKKN